jgi:hypothetical protein
MKEVHQWIMETGLQAELDCFSESLLDGIYPEDTVPEGIGRPTLTKGHPTLVL